MTLPQHHSNNNEWYTPRFILDRVRSTMGDIDLDPASCPVANTEVLATNYYTKEDDALKITYWSSDPANVYMNPPGGKLNNKSQAALFWNKLMEQRKLGLVKQAIVMGFNLNQLAITQQFETSMCDFMMCVPSKRLPFRLASGTPIRPTHNNVIVYVPGTEDSSIEFIENFADIGDFLNQCDRGHNLYN